jgi:hypothetical protein
MVHGLAPPLRTPSFLSGDPMETRASYLLVGTFMLLGIAGLLVAIVWIAGLGLDRDTD